MAGLDPAIHGFDAASIRKMWRPVNRPELAP
jgi:hypothetical protein